MYISVIVPTYNDAGKIEDCIESLLAQGHREFELVIVDDCSTDGTFDIVESYRTQHPEMIKAARNDDNMGPSYTRNRGIKMAGYDYIACIDSDATAPSDWLERAVRNFGAGDLFVGRYIAVPKNDIEEAVYSLTNFPDTDIKYTDSTEGFAVAGTNMFFTRTIFDSVGGFDEDVRACEDMLFLRTAIEIGFVMTYRSGLFVYHSARDSIGSYLRYFDIIQRWYRAVSGWENSRRYRMNTILSNISLAYILIVLLFGNPHALIISLFTLGVIFTMFYTVKMRLKKGLTLKISLLASIIKSLNIAYILKIYIFRQRPV